MEVKVEDEMLVRLVLCLLLKLVVLRYSLVHWFVLYTYSITFSLKLGFPCSPARIVRGFFVLVV